MQIDQTTLWNNQKKNIETTGAAVAGLMQGMTGTAGTEQTGLFIGTENYSPLKATRSASVDMSRATYLRPEKENTVLDSLEEESGQSAMARRNEMAVLATTTSSEDMEAAAEDGYDLSDMDSHTVVTVLDHIKANLAKMGVDVSDMGGDLDEAKLEDITGSEALAQQISASLAAADLPNSKENMDSATEACQEAAALQSLDDSGMAYMMRNQLEPSIGNLYKAGLMQGATGSASISEEDLAQMQDSIAQTLEKAGLPMNEENLADCKWMMEEDLALTPENIAYLQDLQSFSADVENGLSVSTVLGAITDAMAQGKSASDGVLLFGYNLQDQAQNCLDIVNNASDEDLAYLVENDLPLTIANLAEAQNVRAVSGQSATANGKELAMVTAKRQLEETRLAMTSQANLALLKKGISIDTKPLEQLVEDLKEEEMRLSKSLFANAGVEASEENLSIYETTNTYLDELKYAPAKVLNLAEDLDTITDLHEVGTNLTKAYEAAGEKYEQLMTSPRADLGDSMTKAFQNVDDILTDLGLDTSDANRRAVRILAYNETEITEENIAAMKAKDEEVQRVFKNMTPKTVLEMIRRNENPLDMSLSDLNDLAEQINEETGANEEKFSKFLYNLDQKKEITPEERESYIGIYRLFSQVEQTDGAAIGALINQGADLTMRNLLTSVRNGKKSGMDYAIDDDFAGVTGTVLTEKIDDQIMAGYNANLVRDAKEELRASSLAMAMSGDWESKTIEEFTAEIVNAEPTEEDEAAEEAYYSSKQESFAKALEVGDDVYEMLQQLDVENTADNVLAADLFLHQPNEMFARLFKNSGRTKADQIADVQDMKDEILERFGEAVKTPEEMAQAMDELGDVAENVMKTMILDTPEVSALDLQELRMLNQAFLFGKQEAKEENYVIPMETSDGEVTGVSLKIIRGQEKKGFVDLMLRDTLMGKVAASFEAKEDGISGIIATDDEETRQLLSDNLPMLVSGLNESGESSVDLRVAYVKDLSLETFGAQSELRKQQAAEEDTTSQEEKKQNTVQTSRLYGIAESVLNSLKEFGTGSIW